MKAMIILVLSMGAQTALAKTKTLKDYVGTWKAEEKSHGCEKQELVVSENSDKKTYTLKTITPVSSAEVKVSESLEISAQESKGLTSQDTSSTMTSYITTRFMDGSIVSSHIWVPEKNTKWLSSALKTWTLDANGKLLHKRAGHTVEDPDPKDPKAGVKTYDIGKKVLNSWKVECTYAKSK